MKYCKLCGADCKDSAIYCPFCGSKLADQDKPKPQPKSPTLDVDNRGVDLNMPFSFYKDYMSDADLFKIGVARLDGVVLKKDQNEAISIFIYLAKKGYTPATIKLADLCLKDKTTYNEAIVLLKKAADGGSYEAIDQLRKMGIDYLPKNSYEPDRPEKPDSPYRRHPKNPKRWDKRDDYDDDDDDFDDRYDRYDRYDDDDDDDDFDEDNFRKPKLRDRFVEDIADKLVIVKTKSLNSNRVIESVGFLAIGGNVITSFDAINRGAYRKITGSLCDRSSKAYRLKPIKISKKYNIVILKFIDKDYFDVDYFDEINITDEYQDGEKAYFVGVYKGSIETEKCTILELINKNIAPSMRRAIKLKGSFNDRMISPILFNRDGEVIGIIYDIKGNKAYAAPGKYIRKVLMQATED